MTTKITTESFIKQAQQIHGDRYDYSQVEYVNSQTKVKIICSEHGLFEQSPNGHIHQKQGCWECGLELRANNRVNKAKLKFKERASIVHNNKYDYSLVEYTGTRDKIDIICPKHGVYSQTPDNHINGSQGCPTCADILRSQNTGWTRTNFKQKCDKNNNGLGILYILECFNEQERFFKIGITSLSVKKRYKSKTSMPYAYRVIDEIIGDPEFIYDLETKLHNLNKQYKYIPNIPFGGHLTECFNKYRYEENDDYDN